METQNKHRCQVCEESVPNSAEFCPFCGGTQRRMTTPLTALDAVLPRQTEMMESVEPVEQTIFFGEPRVEPLFQFEIASDENWEDEIFYDPGRGKRISAGLVIFFSVAAVAIASLFLVAQIQAPIELAGAVVSPNGIDQEAKTGAVAEQAPKKQVVKATVMRSGKVATVQIGGQTVFELAVKKGSRYSSLKKRAESVEVRLNHVLKQVGRRGAGPKKQVAVFVARTNGDRSEVSWQNPKGSYFRVLDVTKNDVRSWSRKHKSKTSAHILSNLLADELNAVMEKSFPEQS